MGVGVWVGATTEHEPFSLQSGGNGGKRNPQFHERAPQADRQLTVVLLSSNCHYTKVAMLGSTCHVLCHPF